METLGVENADFFNIYILLFFFLPLLHVHTVINELEEGWAGRCFCQPK